MWLAWVVFGIGVVAFLVWAFGMLEESDGAMLLGGFFALVCLLSSIGSCSGSCDDWNAYARMEALKTNIGVYEVTNTTIGEYEYTVPSSVITDLAQNNTGSERAKNVVALQNEILFHNNGVAKYNMIKNNWPLRFLLYSAKLPEDYGYITIEEETKK